MYGPCPGRTPRGRPAARHYVNRTTGLPGLLACSRAYTHTQHAYDVTVEHGDPVPSHANVNPPACCLPTHAYMHRDLQHFTSPKTQITSNTSQHTQSRRSQLLALPSDGHGRTRCSPRYPRGLVSSLVHSLTHSLTHSLIHSLTHSLTQLNTPSQFSTPSDHT